MSLTRITSWYQRNRERKHASQTLRTLHLNLAAVCFHRQFAEGQTEAGADFARVELAEFFEDSLERFGRDAFAGIADGEPYAFAVVRRRSDGHRTGAVTMAGAGGNTIGGCAAPAATGGAGIPSLDFAGLMVLTILLGGLGLFVMKSRF